MAFCLHVSLHLCLYVVVILEELCALHQLGIVTLQGISGNPSLDGCTTPTIDNDTLWHLGLFLHPFAKEITDCREKPGILFVQGLPVDRSGIDIVSHPMSIGLVLYTEETDRIVFVGINLLGVLWVDTLDGYVDIRLSGEQPYITDQNIGEHLIANSEGIGTTSLHLWQVDAPVAIGVSIRHILLLIKSDGYQLSWCGLTPNRDYFSPLEYHTGLEQLWQTDFCLCERGGQ